MSEETTNIILPPMALVAEEACLGSALIEAPAARWLFQATTEAVFYKTIHRIIYKAMKVVFERDEVIDPTLIIEELRKTGDLGEVGGPTYVVGLTKKVSTAAHVKHYGNLVLRAYYDRELWRASHLLREEDKRDEAIDKITRIVRAKDLTYARGGISIKEAAHQVVDDIQDAEENPVDLIKIGLPAIDFVTGGHENGDLVVWGARPRVGKTAVLLTIAMNMARNLGKTIAYFAGEMTGKQVVRRAIASESGIFHSRLRARNIRKDQWATLTAAAAKLSELPIQFCTIPSPSLRDIAAFSDAVRADIVIVDYLTRCTLPDAETERVRVNHFMRGLKNLGRETDRLIHLGAQLNRQMDKIEDKRPNLSDLKESGAIEEEADVVILMHCTKANVESNETVPVECAVAKNRNGMCGGADILFDKKLMRITAPHEGEKEEKKNEQTSFI